MRDITLTIDHGPHGLAATLVADHEPGPAALLLSGSGPLDRDSNTKRLRVDAMGQIAAHLAGAGIGSLRYDKRGVGRSGGTYLATGFHDNVADARAALDALRARPEVDPDRIVIVGHSEGALLAAELAAHDRGLAGVVFLAGPAGTGDEVLRWQGQQVAATLPRAVKGLLRLLRQDVTRTQAKRLAQLKASSGDTVRIQLVKLNARWFREFLAHDPAPALRSIEVPVLAVAGAKDLQVDPADAGRIGELVGGESTVRVLDDLTHLLRREPGPPSLRTYRKQVKRPVDPELLSLLASWIAERTAPVPCAGPVAG